jgi:hypothetical protein
MGIWAGNWAIAAWMARVFVGGVLLGFSVADR